MARVVVYPDGIDDATLDERDVRPVHLETETAARQLLQRVAWAVEDAERRPRRPSRRPTRLEMPQAASSTAGPFD
jgi:hypothetical protein